MIENLSKSARLLVVLSCVPVLGCYTYQAPSTEPVEPTEHRFEAPAENVWTALLEIFEIRAGWEISRVMKDSWTFRTSWAAGRSFEGADSLMDCGTFTSSDGGQIPVTQHDIWGLEGALVVKLIEEGNEPRLFAKASE